MTHQVLEEYNSIPITQMTINPKTVETTVYFKTAY